MDPNLSPPPKFGPAHPAPLTIADWLAFFRWLVSLYRKAASDIGASESITISPRAPRAISTEEILSAGRVAQQGKPPVPNSRELDLAGIQAARLGQPGRVSDDLTAITTYLMDRPPYPVRPLPTVIRDTHAHRVNYAPAAYDGWWYWETSQTIPDTDRTSLYLSVNGVWEYVGGEMQSSSATLGDVPGDLGADDAAFRYRNSFFYRTWEWDGGAWHYADNGVGAGAQVSTSGGSGPPSGGLWQACNGASVTTGEDNATLGTRTASNTAAVGGNNPMIEGGLGGTQQPAVAGTYISNFTSSASSATVGAGTGAIVATDQGHFHQVPAMNPPSETNGGLPLRVSMAWYMRR